MGKLEDSILQKSFSDPYHKAVVNVHFTHNYVLTHHNKIFKAHGISPEQYNVLRILRGQKGNPITITSIQNRMLNRMSNASRLVDKLKAKGLLVRNESARDRRQMDILITQKGLMLLEELEELVLKINREIIQLNLEEVTTLNDLLDKLRG